MADAFITIQLEGSDVDNGDVRFGDFIQELTAIRNALKRTQRLVMKVDSDAIEYKIADLSHSSPARVRVQISSLSPVYKDKPREISRRFTTSLNAVRRNHRYAERLDMKTLEIFRDISAPVKKRVTRVVVTGEKNQSVQIDRDFDRNITHLLRVDFSEWDELVGRVERADIHNKNQFDIYPVIGAERVRCSAPSALHGDVVTALGKTVSVEGLAYYRKDQPFPYAMQVKKIFPRLQDSELPKMTDLHGTAPDITEGLSGEDFVRKLRDAYW